ncbi:uncharacterized protein LOC111641726 [Centruroides sculpturatus]|uniref:uncharacterized protein LOC111641726 n=1 Tax=Centruroides sculpturatus TaxID=218467 RepID=UPI000C6CCB60|nr:uncharacterized protein LOC111641726 [Centruroides sculpturatus]
MNPHFFIALLVVNLSLLEIYEAKEELINLQKRDVGVKIEHERRDGRNHRTGIRVDAGRTWKTKDGRGTLQAGGFYSRDFEREGGRRFRRPDYGVGVKFNYKF